MRINIFFKTFLMLLISFSIVFLLNMYISYERFSPLYIEENINNVKDSIASSVPLIEQGVLLNDTSLTDLSSETSFIRFRDNTVSESVGPNYISDAEILGFVIDIYDEDTSIVEDRLTYNTELVDDIYHINYIYEFERGDYLIIQTRVQSLENIDSVLIQINFNQSIYMFVMILLISVLISVNISIPLKKINGYAKNVSSLILDKPINLKRRDEFGDLITSLNEMSFNLKKTYDALNDANQKLTSDFDLEKQQEEKKKELIMTINHEIKTPLAVMKGMIEGMIDQVGRYKDRDKYLKELIVQIETIEHMTKDLTYTLRLEDKTKNGECSSTSVINQSIDDLSIFASQNHVHIQNQIEKANLIISKDLLEILVANLVKNAIIYTEAKQVIVKGEIIGDDYHFSVVNKGHIADEELNKLFDSFYRVKHNNQKGTGLGLFIVKQISDIYHYPYKIFNDSENVVSKIQIKIQK